MNIPKCLDFENYDKYPSDENPTTDDQIQDFLGNQNKLVKALTNQLWQPLTNLVYGQIIHSPNMPAGVLAVVITAGQTGSSEPTWSSIGSVVQDGGVVYRIKEQTGDYLPLDAGVSNPLTGNLYIQSDKIEIDIDPEDYLDEQINFVDKKGTLLSQLIYRKYPDGRKIGMLSVKKSKEESSFAVISCGFTADGKPIFTTSSTPTIDDNSNTIATTKFVQDTLKLQEQSNQNNSIYYRSTLESIQSVPGSFWFDSNSGVPNSELPSDIGTVDWWGLQLGMQNGADKTQIIYSSTQSWFRYDDNAVGSEKWVQASWKKGIPGSFSVTASTQANINPSVSAGMPSSYGITVPNVEKGIAAGTYTLINLLQNLVNMSHTHTAVYRNGSNCVCDCDCNCQCSD